MQQSAIAGRFRTDVLDAVDEITSAPNVGSLFGLLARTFAAFSFDHFIIAGIPPESEPLEHAVLLRHWPAGWFEQYLRGNFIEIDPVVRMYHATTMPFEWSEAPLDPRQPDGAEMMNLACDFGLRRGFSLPIHGLDGRIACVSLGGRRPELDARTKPALHLLSMYAFESARRLRATRTSEAGGVDEPGRTNPLTRREREVLTWAAVGKSHADIAEILGIAERTVTAHTVNATVKLGASNRTHAVVKAVHSRFIRI